jgi:CRP-like cAMP-binding protein
MPMLDDLRETELAEIISCFSEVRLNIGETLYREGAAATSASFLIDGELEALKALPGGGETELGTITPGAMIGEMALLEDGVRTATVRARKASTVLKVSCYFFHAALDQMRAPAFKILRAISHTLTGRLDELQKRILEQWDCEPYMAAATNKPADEFTVLPPSFEFRPFLSVMPWLSSFDEGEIDSVLAHGKPLEIPRREFLYREGAPVEFCYLVLRGAVELSVMRDRRYQLSVLGPGRFCGVNAIIADKMATSDARVRSQALLLRFDRAEFEHLFLGDTTDCLKFQNLISADQLRQLKAADNLLAMLVSQSYVLNEPRSRAL